MKTSKILPLALVATVALGLFGPSAPAIAGRPSSEAVEVAATANKAAAIAVGDGPEATAFATTASGSAVAETAMGAVVISPDPTDGITLGSGDSKISIRLPIPHSESRTEVVGGDAVIDGAELSFLVDALPGGVRISSVIKTKEADHSPTYRLELPAGVAPTVNADGSVSLNLDTTQGVDLSLATIAAPWAVDATGKPVDTRYEVDGATITQVVTPGPSSVYPIVADPSISGCLIGGFYPAICIKYNRTETERAYASVIAGIGATAFASELCSLIPTLAVKAACKAAVAAAAALVFNNVRLAHDRGKCLEIRFTYPAIVGITLGSAVVNC